MSVPVWSFAPNWKEGVLESLEWLTDILRSPTGAEQRRALRLFPRRTFEFTIALKGPERSYFDSMIFEHGAREWYLPIWHDPHELDASVTAGVSFLPCATANLSLAAGDTIFIASHSAFNFEVATVFAVSSSGITTVAPLASSWGLDAQIFPVRKARFTEQPQPRRASDDTITAQIRFRVAERNDDFVPTLTGDIYRSFTVLTTPPDDSESLTGGFERILEELDNQVGLPAYYDSANRSFPFQQHSWTLSGRDEHMGFMKMLYALRGKAQPIWVPTFFADFEPLLDVPPNGTAITVRNTGFTNLGGPKSSRQDILIETSSGTRIYRRILASTIVGANEVIGLDAGIPSGLKVNDIVRISFMTLCRLNQDAIEISHKTDVNGVSTVVATFRNAPELRQVATGF